MITRRHLLLGLPALALAGCATPPAPDAPPPVLRGPLDANALAWLDRLSWGACERDAARLQARGLAGWLDDQLRPAAPDALPAALNARFTSMAVQQPMPDLARRLDAQRRAAEALSDPEARAQAMQTVQLDNSRLAREAAERLLLRAVHSPRQLQSRMGWFWLNHFSVFHQKANLRVLVADYEQQLHAQALGRFRDLLGTVTFHPAMLRFLDNEQNAAGRINENLGRELLELHTLGVDGGYSQRDVQEVSRVLTGLGVSLNEQAPRLAPDRAALYQRRGLTEFNPMRHDTGPKTVLGEPVTGQGVAEIEGVLDRLARHPSTARHLSRKIARYLMADEPPAAVVEAMAQRYLARDGRIDEVLRALFERPEFGASLGRRFKDPSHWVLSAVRQGLDPQGLVQGGQLNGWLQRLGQAPFQRGTPDGYPLDTAAWSAPGQLVTRFELARQIAAVPASLYREDGAGPPAPAPHWQDAFWQQQLAPRLSAATRQALAQTNAPRERAALWLSSPEFMQH